MDIVSLWVFDNFLFLALVLCFSVSFPWRKPFYTNWLLNINLVILYIMAIIFPLIPNSRNNETFPLYGFVEEYESYDWMVACILWAHLYAAIMIIYEIVVVNILCSKLYFMRKERNAKLE